MWEVLLDFLKTIGLIVGFVICCMIFFLGIVFMKAIYELYMVEKKLNELDE